MESGTPIPADAAAYSLIFGSIGFALFLVQAYRQFAEEERVLVIVMCLGTWGGGIGASFGFRDEPVAAVVGAIGATMLGILLFTRGRVDLFINLPAYLGDLPPAATTAHNSWQFRIVLKSLLVVGLYGLGLLFFWQT